MSEVGESFVAFLRELSAPDLAVLRRELKTSPYPEDIPYVEAVDEEFKRRELSLPPEAK